jgi:hypothetical protein
VATPRFLSLLCVPIVVALACWASCTVLDSLDLPAEHDACTDEALSLIVPYVRRDEALDARQKRARPAEAPRIAAEREGAAGADARGGG